MNSKLEKAGAVAAVVATLDSQFPSLKYKVGSMLKKYILAAAVGASALVGGGVYSHGKIWGTPAVHTGAELQANLGKEVTVTMRVVGGRQFVSKKRGTLTLLNSQADYTSPNNVTVVLTDGTKPDQFFGKTITATGVADSYTDRETGQTSYQVRVASASDIKVK